ncbi:MAG: hypothetical protein AAF481_07270 [Acidobacteriota bacterium]
MIRSLRRRHRWMWIALAVALPLLFVLALAARPEFPLTAHAPATAAPPPTTSDDDLFPDHPLSARLGAGPGGPRLWVDRPPGRSVEGPDLLLYWSVRGGSGDGTRLPADARLLGPLTAGRSTFDLPTANAGELVVYSLGHHRVVVRSSLDRPANGGDR